MTSYRVEWAIDVEADNAAQAAQLAHAMMRKPNTTATVYDVMQMDSPDDPVRVDLMDPPTVRCNNCGFHGVEDDLIQVMDSVDGEITKACPKCETDSYLMDLDHFSGKEV